MRYDYLDMLPEEAFQKDPFGNIKLYKKGGGAPAPSSQTVTNTSIPEYARPYVERMLGKTEALTDINKNPYQTYGGQRIAEFSPMQQQAFSNVGNMQTASQLGNATNLAGMSGLGSLGTASQMAGAGNQYNQMATSPYATQAFMNPYLNASLQPQLQEIGRQYDITGQQEQSRATGQGAFGGNRQALMQAENARNKNMAMNTAIGTGYNNAFNQAQQAQQFGANLGLQGLQGALSGYGQAGQAAGTLGQLGQTQFGQQQAINAAQQQVGAVQQAQAQQNLDQGYQDFLKQQNYPYQQLAFMSDMTRGLPLSNGPSQSIYTAPPSVASQLGGLGMAGLGAYTKAGGFNKEGGIISSYKQGGKIGYNTGGDISMMSDEQLTELLGNPQLNPMEMKAVEDMLALRRRMQINPQSAEIMGQDRSGIGAIATGDMVPEDMAGGGIIAFKDKGAVKAPTIDDEALLQEKIAKYGSEIWDKPAFSKSDEMQKALAEEAKAAKNSRFADFLIDAGIGTAKGTSQFGLANLGGGLEYANTQAGKRAELQDASEKLAMQQQVEAEKAEFARKSGMLNNMQTSLTQLQNKKLGLAQIAATKEAAAANAAAAREAALLPKYSAIYNNALAKNKAVIEKQMKDNFTVYDFTPEQVTEMAVAQTNKQFDPKVLSLLGVATEQVVAPAPAAAKPGAVPSNKPARVLTTADQQAIAWAKANPKDPRAAIIKQKLGV
jgi:hypothetical protein